MAERKNIGFRRSNREIKPSRRNENLENSKSLFLSALSTTDGIVDCEVKSTKEPRNVDATAVKQDGSYEMEMFQRRGIVLSRLMRGIS